MKFYITLFLLTLIINNQLQCQFLNSEVNANSEIKGILYSELGEYYYVNSFDVNLRKIDHEYYIQDKSNLLTDCFVFVAKDSLNYSAILFGVYKVGSILWKSRVFSCGKSIIFSGDIWQIRNLKPNKVYVIFQLPYIPDGYESNIWIISWDGISGSVVNEVNSEDFSTISSTTNSIKFIDIDGDGNEELLGVKVDSTIYNTEVDTSVSYVDKTLYTWNGNIISDYGVTLPEILPKNKFNATISTTLRYNNIYTYKYIVSNSSSSIQSIQTFAVGSDIDTVIEKHVPLKWVCINSTSLMVIFTVDPFYIDDEDSKIPPGESNATFTFSSENLPSIVKFYVQGYNGNSNDYNNLSNNSKNGYTVGPSAILDTLNVQSFLDTLMSYCNQSFVLSWMTNQITADKYDSLFNVAKTQIQQNNNNAAKVTLQTVLQQVDIDSTNSLTSEAYALIKYNTEYLLRNIPQSSPNLLVNLKNSLGNQIPASNVQYYEGSWKDAVNNGDGTFTVITTKPTVSIRVYYEYASKQADNVPAQNNTYTFTTVNASVQLKNSLGNLIDQGTVQYYAGVWRTFGTTSNGVATKELLPINYSFRMTYEYGSVDKQQDISVDPSVVFQTVNATVQLKNSLGSLIDEGTVQYYAGAWRSFGTTTNGVAAKELLPVNYSFRMIYEYGSIDKQQNLSSDPTVVFQTVNAAVRLKNSLGSFIDVGIVQYYAGAWRDFGTTVNGVATKELLPINYSFRMTYEYVSNDKQQNISVNQVIDFSTVLCSVKVINNTNNQPLDNAAVKYYAGAWRDLGTTNTEGISTKELLTANISFRASYGNVSQDKQQDISVNNLVEILLNIP